MGKDNYREGLKDVTNTTKTDTGILKNQNRLTKREMKILGKHINAEKREIVAVSKYAIKIDKFYEEIDKNKKIPKSIDYKQRLLILDWIIGMQSALGLTDDTLYFCIQLLDLFLSKNRLGEAKLYLAGIAALLISAKYEEVEWPDIKTLIKAGSVDLSEDDVKKAERCMLYNTNYDILFVNPLYFLRRAAKANEYEEKSRFMAKYFLELISITDHCYKFNCKIKASTCMYLARKICKQDLNKNLFLQYCKIDQTDMSDCLIVLIKLLYSDKISHNLELKYNQKALHYVNVIARKYVQQTFSSNK
ncbi:cdc13 [Nucleospora cyclopteri]